MTIFAIYLQLCMWFYKGIKVNISATMQNFVVALIYKINPVQITTIIAENTENSFSPIVKLNLAFFQVPRLLLHHYC